MRGKVIDQSTGQGLPFANVYYSDADGEILNENNLGTATDLLGSYGIDTRAGHLTASYTGYGKITKKVSPGQTTMDFYLSPGVTLGGVEIIASRPMDWKKWAIAAGIVIAAVLFAFYIRKL